MTAPRGALRRTLRALLLVLAALLVGVLPAGCTGGAPVVPTQPPVATSSTVSSPESSTTGSTVSPTVPAAPGTALAVLDALAVRERATADGYTREQFGQRWADVDRNGCDTRNDVLARDLTDVRFRDGSRCVVASGTLADPYTGAVLPFLRGEQTSDDIQIDHVVALAAAWRTGAQGWDAATRTAFANDPLNLLAVDGAANQAKGDSDAAAWLPPAPAERCAYVARQIAVKQRYNAWVTPPERDAMAAVLRTCPAQPLPGSPAPVAWPDPSSTPSVTTGVPTASDATTTTTIATTAASPPPVDGCLIKGNINREGEKIYHVPGSRSYDETRVDLDRGERWFCTEADALAAGWRAPLG